LPLPSSLLFALYQYDITLGFSNSCFIFHCPALFFKGTLRPQSSPRWQVFLEYRSCWPVTELNSQFTLAIQRAACVHRCHAFKCVLVASFHSRPLHKSYVPPAVSNFFLYRFRVLSEILEARASSNTSIPNTRSLIGG